LDLSPLEEPVQLDEGQLRQARLKEFERESQREYQRLKKMVAD
jgi:hypothetical protein